MKKIPALLLQNGTVLSGGIGQKIGFAALEKTAKAIGMKGKRCQITNRDADNPTSESLDVEFSAGRKKLFLAVNEEWWVIVSD